MKRFLLLLLLAPSLLAQTVMTATANNVTVHFGDEIPGLNFLVSNAVWGTAVASGDLKASTTYTKGAAVGTYPITLASDPDLPISMNPGYSLNMVSGTLTVIPATGLGARINNSVVVPPAGAIQSLASGNGTCSAITAGSPAAATANTTNWNCFFFTGRPSGKNGSYTNAPKMFFLPDGDYYFNDTLAAPGCCIMLMGTGPGKAKIHLMPQSAGFGNAGTFKQFLFFQGGPQNNQGFWEFLYNVGVVIHSGNPGVGALTFIGNNANAARNVQVTINDSLAFSSFFVFNAFPGPTMYTDIAVYGGRFGVQANQQSEYTVTFERLTVQNQTVDGIITGATSTAVKSLFSSQEMAGVPAWSAQVATNTLYDGELLNGGSTQTAILQNSGGANMVVKNVTTTGYQFAMNDINGGALLSTPIAFHASGTTFPTFGSQLPSFLTVPDTPMPNDPPAVSWAKLPYDITTWGTALAACTSSTYYVEVISNYPANVPDNTNIANFTGTYKNPGTAQNITVPDCVNHIVMNDFRYLVTTGARINWQITGSSSTPLIIEDSSQGMTFDHFGSRTLVLKDLSGEYYCQAGAGDLYLDAVQLGGTNNPVGTIPHISGPEHGQVDLCPGQHAYMRGFDQEAEGQNVTMSTASYTDSTKTLVVNAAVVDPYLYLGVPVYFTVASGPFAFINRTAAILTNISGNQLTLTWQGGSHADVPLTSTGGTYAAEYNKLAGTGVTLWVLNYKSEKPNPDLFMRNSIGEIWGGFKYPVSRPPAIGYPVYKTVDMTSFFGYFQLFSNAPQWDNFYTDTRNGVTVDYPNPLPGGSTFQSTKFFYSTPSFGKHGITEGNGRLFGTGRTF